MSTETQESTEAIAHPPRVARRFAAVPDNVLKPSFSTQGSPLFRLRLMPSDVMVDRTMSVRPNRIGGAIGQRDDADMLRINRALALFLGIAS